jgi:hypothetical protein
MRGGLWAHVLSVTPSPHSLARFAQLLCSQQLMVLLQHMLHMHACGMTTMLQQKLLTL